MEVGRELFAGVQVGPVLVWEAGAYLGDGVPHCPLGVGVIWVVVLEIFLCPGCDGADGPGDCAYAGCGEAGLSLVRYGR